MRRMLEKGWFSYRASGPTTADRTSSSATCALRRVHSARRQWATLRLLRSAALLLAVRLLLLLVLPPRWLLCASPTTAAETTCVERS